MDKEQEMNNEDEIKRVEESIHRRTMLIGSHVPVGDRIAAFMALSETIKTNPVLAQEFAALREEHRELERLKGIKEWEPDLIMDNFDDFDEMDLMFMDPEDLERWKNSPMSHAGRFRHPDGEQSSAEDFEDHWFGEKKTYAQRRAVLTALVEKGGMASDKEIIERYEQLMRSSLEPEDYVPVRTNDKEPAWEARCRYTRKDLQILGWMEDDSPSKVWEITPEGRQRLLMNDLNAPVKPTV